MTDCPHSQITTWTGEASTIWACADCRRRFYPACPECVDVGHREGHPEPTDVAEARNQGYREGRLAVWDELREYVEENADVARRVLGAAPR